MTKDKLFYAIAYVVMSVLALALIGCSVVSFGHPSAATQAKARLVPVESGFTNSVGVSVDIEHLQKEPDVIPGVPYKLYYTLPEEITPEMALNFRTKNVYVDIYHNDELVYQQDRSGKALHSKAPGTNWVFYDLPESLAGETIELRVTTAYSNSKSRIDTITLGSAKDALLVTIYDKLYALISCLIFMFAGIILMILDIPINMGKAKNHELFFLGFSSATLAVWGFVTTYIPQVFTGDGRSIHITSCLFLMLFPASISLYLYECFGKKVRVFAGFVIILSIINMLLNVALQLLGVQDFQETLWHTHIILGFAAAFFLLCVGILIVERKKRKYVPLFYRVTRVIGYTAIGVTALVDCVRYYIGSEDTGRYIRIGLLIYIICSAILSMEQSLETIKLGAKTEVISKLAYEDGLTGLGNRTRYNEYLEKLDEVKIREGVEVAIVMFDVNDLKRVNDELGHQAGDDLLIAGAEVIKDAFGKEAECFRIGGDEFVAVLTGSNVRKRMETCVQVFHEKLYLYNVNSGKLFKVRIAHGSGVYTPNMGNQELKNTEQIADAMMYECKKEMKSTGTDVLRRTDILRQREEDVKQLEEFLRNS